MSNLAKLVFVLIAGQISGERLHDHWSSGLYNHIIMIIISLYFRPDMGNLVIVMFTSL